MTCFVGGAAAADPAQPTVTAALAAGASATPLPIDGDNYVGHGFGGFLDGEVGMRFGNVGFAAFGRWAHTPKTVIDVDGSEYGYNVRMDDLAIGLRGHFWASRRLRLTFGVGRLWHREIDGNTVPPGTPDGLGPTPDYRAHDDSQRIFLQAQIAFALVRIGPTELELGFDLTTAPTGTAIAALGLGVRL